MTTSLHTRVRRLEGASYAVTGGGECPRCSGTTLIHVHDALHSVSRHGRILTPEEAEAFAGEEEGGCSPVCGATRGTGIRIGSPAPARGR
jgi:hypothetical protein